MNKMITCDECGKVKPKYAKGLCGNCYRRQYSKKYKRLLKKCKSCGEIKVIHGYDLCKLCYDHKNNKIKSMYDDKSCSNYLGIVIAEQVLSKVFKNVTQMPNNNPGYDFICSNGFKIDVKSSCLNGCYNKKYNKNYYNWKFVINKNKIPDYFLCLAFDNRENLNPLYLWLIPGNIINDKSNITISSSTISKWNEYKLDINKVIDQCNTMKGDD